VGVVSQQETKKQLDGKFYLLFFIHISKRKSVNLYNMKTKFLKVSLLAIVLLFAFSTSNKAQTINYGFTFSDPAYNGTNYYYLAWIDIFRYDSYSTGPIQIFSLNPPYTWTPGTNNSSITYGVAWPQPDIDPVCYCYMVVVVKKYEVGQVTPIATRTGTSSCAEYNPINIYLTDPIKVTSF